MTRVTERQAISGEGSAAAEAPPLIAARGLGVWYGETPVFEGLSFDLPPRSVLGVLGPSGAGKSTLLRCLNRLVDLEPAARVSGSVALAGRDIRGRGVDSDALRARVGMLFQQPSVFPASVAQNVLFGARRLRRLPRRERPVLVERCLREAALWDQARDRLDAPAATLSVGQQQRLCLARALATDPEVVLLDEPTSALDAETSEAIEATFAALARSRSLVLVTHDAAQAERLSHRRIWLEGREGA